MVESSLDIAIIDISSINRKIRSIFKNLYKILQILIKYVIT